MLRPTSWPRKERWKSGPSRTVRSKITHFTSIRFTSWWNRRTTSNATAPCRRPPSPASTWIRSKFHSGTGTLTIHSPASRSASISAGMTLAISRGGFLDPRVQTAERHGPPRGIFGDRLGAPRARHHGRRLAFDYLRREHVRVMFQPGQLVRVNLAGLHAEGVMFQAAVTDAVAHIVKQTSEQPPKYLVKLLFSFRGVTEVEVPPERFHAAKYPASPTPPPVIPND